MKVDDLDRFLDEMTSRSLAEGNSRESIEHVEKTLLSDLRPVRPMAAVWAWSLGFEALFIAFGTASASMLGLHGLHVLSASQRGLIFLTLLAVAWLASVACAREMRPTGLRLGVFSLIVAALALPGLFALVFHDYGASNFVHEGVPCLVAGMCVSIPTAFVSGYLLRRGFVAGWGMAGLAAGTLSGLTGLAMLELHCSNLKAIHVIVWHIAVVIVSGILGFSIGWAVGRLRRISI